MIIWFVRNPCYLVEMDKTTTQLLAYLCQGQVMCDHLSFEKDNKDTPHDAPAF